MDNNERAAQMQPPARDTLMQLARIQRQQAAHNNHKLTNKVTAVVKNKKADDVDKLHEKTISSHASAFEKDDGLYDDMRELCEMME